jgi:hypothetical protein
VLNWLHRLAWRLLIHLLGSWTLDHGVHHRHHLSINVNVLHWLLIHILLLRLELLQLRGIELWSLLLRLLLSYLLLNLLLVFAIVFVKESTDVPSGHSLEIG